MKLFEPQLARLTVAAKTGLDPAPAARAGRSRADDPRPAQPGAECDRRHARWRHPDRRTLALAGGVRLEVSDTGQGLTPEECERLFTPYYTTKTHGTGLGLAIVQSVVSDHKGRISVESQPGKGSTFRIDIIR